MGEGSKERLVKERIAVNKGRFLRSRSDPGLYLHTTFVMDTCTITLRLLFHSHQTDKSAVFHHQSVQSMQTYIHIHVFGV